MAFSRQQLLVQAFNMLSSGSANRWLSASAAHQHSQVPGCVLLRHVAAVHGIAACHQASRHGVASTAPSCATTSLSECCKWHSASPAPLQSSQRSAVGCCKALPCSFQLPGTSHTSCSGTRRGLQGWGVSNMPSSQQSSSTDSSCLQVAGAAQHSMAAVSSTGIEGNALFRKRPAEMTEDERMMYLRQAAMEEYDWDPGQLEAGSTSRLVCPVCGNGSKGELGFAVTAEADATGKIASIVWCCHRASCGHTGGVSISRQSSNQWAVDAANKGGFQAATPSHQPTQWPPPQQQQQQQPPSLQPLTAGLAKKQQWMQQLTPEAKAQTPVLGSKLQELSPELLEWFRGRGISKAVLDRSHVKMEHKYCRALNKEVDHVAFPFFMDGVIVNIKYRALPKYFHQVMGGSQVFYGYDEAQGADEVIIVEGEMDKLAVEEALLHGATAAPVGQDPGLPPSATGGFLSPAGGRRAVVSVPAGAPSPTAQNLERKYKFLDDCCNILARAHRVILAVDNDAPGIGLAEELARRIGREKCLMVNWPVSRETSFAPGVAATADVSSYARKDACEVLEKDGPAVLKQYIDAAKPLPIRGLYTFDKFWTQVYDLWNQGPSALSWGISTGWDTVDEYYKVVPGELTIVTGLSNSGKSEWLDALTVNLAQENGWNIAVCSLENTPREHGRKLMEKYLGKPLLASDFSHGAVPMTYQDVLDALVWIDEHFHLIRPLRDEMPSIDFILDRARAAVTRYGIRGLVIDPYNELDPRRASNMFETEYVSRTLTKVKRFAQHYDCHVWFVAHPRTQRGLGVGGGGANLSAPTMYDISGSAHFINKADNGIVIHRPYSGVMAAAEGHNTNLTQILVRKVRNKLAGRIGDVTLSYDRATGRYST